MVERLVERTGETLRAQRSMYKSVEQLVLLCDSEIWVVTR